MSSPNRVRFSSASSSPSAPPCWLLALALLPWLAPTPSFAVAPSNRVTYAIEVDLDTKEKRLKGREVLQYANVNATAPLTELKFHLYARAFRGRDSFLGRTLEERSQDFRLARRTKKKLGDASVSDVTVDGKPVEVTVDDTILTLRLAEPLAPSKTARIEMAFETKLPEMHSRMGWEKNDFSIGQWYPQVCRYDAAGWHAEPYGPWGEFFSDLGDFEVKLSLPPDFYVAHTGELVSAEGGDNDIPVWDSEAGKKAPKKPTPDAKARKTLVLRAANVRDFAFVASRDVVQAEDAWDGIKTRVVFHRGEEKTWKDAAKWAAESVRLFSEWFGRYPYPQMTVAAAASGAGGMEYPMLVMVSGVGESIPLPLSSLTKRVLEMVCAHEIAHNWFPMQMNTDERAEAWLDEGFATYAEIRYLEERHGNSRLLVWPKALAFLPTLVDRDLQHFSWQRAHRAGYEEPVLTRADDYASGPGYAAASYSKGSSLLFMLRHRMGAETFDRALRSYVETYRWKSPNTAEFRAHMQTASHTDLSEWFDTFLTTTKASDLVCAELATAPGPAGSSDVQVSVERRGAAVMPVDVELELADGSRVRKTVETRNRVTVVPFTVSSTARRAVLDPDGVLLDLDRRNNDSDPFPPLRLAFPFSLPDPNAHDITLTPTLWQHRVDGARIGLLVHSGASNLSSGPSLVPEPHAAIGVSWPVRGDRPAISTRFGDALPGFGRRTSWQIGFRAAEARLRGEFELSTIAARHPLREPRHRVTLKYQHEQVGVELNRTDSITDRYLDIQTYGSLRRPAHWDLSAVDRLALSYSSRWVSAFASLDTAAALTTGAWSPLTTLPGTGRPSGRRFTTGSVSAVAKLRLLRVRDVALSVRAFGMATLSGDPPRQDRERLDGANGVTADRSWFLNEGGPIRALSLGDNASWGGGRFFVDGGGGMRGYFGRNAYGQRLGAVNVELRGVPVLAPFFDAAIFALPDPGYEDVVGLAGETVMDAGVSLRLGLFRIDVPLWVSHPPLDAAGIRSPAIDWRRFVVGFATPF